MNHFPQNLSILRRRAGYTQESLAEVLGVSRQAVSKWEGGQGLPEAATLLTLADLLGCSLDQLMREELATEEPVPGREEPVLEEPAPEDPYYIWDIFSQHMTRFALSIAGGVTLILGGVSATAFLALFFGDDSGLIAVPLLLCVAVAVFLFVYAGTGHDSFMKGLPLPPLCPDPEEEGRFRQIFRIGLAGAVGGMLVDVALLAVAASFFEGSETLMCFATGVFLALLALCVGVIVYLGIQYDKYDEEADFRVDKRRRDPDVEGVIMLIATGVFLLMGFVWNKWHPGWVAFPIGGILCAIAGEVKKGGEDDY